MAENEVRQEGCGQSDGDVPEVERASGPEIVPTASSVRRGIGGRVILQGLAEEATYKYLKEIVDCFVVNIKGMKHLPSLKMLFELADKLDIEGSVSEADCESVAQTLWKAYRELQEEEKEGTA